LDQNVRDFTSDLPIVTLDNYGHGRPGQTGFQFNMMSIYEPSAASGRSSLNVQPDLATRAGLEVRGSSTAGNEKAAYAMEAWDELNRDRIISPLGLPPDSDWILYADYDFDRALMRNVLIFELSNQMGRYAVRTRYVELFHNMDGGNLSENDYRGVYVLMEKIKGGPNRVDVVPLEPGDINEPEISGGWILKNDRGATGDLGFRTDANVTIHHVEPEEDDLTPVQGDWIQNHFNEMYASLTDRNPETGYTQYIDVLSWIDHHILNVLPMNVDAFRLSGYFFKDRGGKFEMGPIWDFDRSMESTDGRDDRPDVWDGPPDSTVYFKPDSRHPWWGILFEDPNFMQQWIDRWYELRKGVLSDQNISATIDALAAQITEAQVRNFERWTLRPRSGSGYNSGKLDGTWRGEVEHLKAWLLDRAHWIDRQFIAPPTIDPSSERVPMGTPIRMANDDGAIYYMLDGSDPRLPGGAVHPEAIAFNPSIVLVHSDSPASYLVPTGAPGEAGWQNSGFDDGAWSSGPASIGYDTGITDAAIRLESGFTVRDVTSSGFVGSLFAADLLFEGQNVASEVTVSGVPVLNYLDGGSDGHFPESMPFPGSPDRNNFAIQAKARIIVDVAGIYTFGVNSDEGSRLRIDGLEVIRDPLLHEPRDAFGSVNLTVGTHELEFMMFERADGAAAELFYARGTHTNFSDAFILLGGQQSFDPLIKTDVEAAMHNVNSSLYVRIPFMASDVDQIERLYLRMAYDDAFAAYLNGVEVARRNSPAELSYDSAASGPRADGDALIAERINISAFRHLLKDDENVLAIQGLNVSANSPDFLQVPTLEASLYGTPLIFSDPLSIHFRTWLEGTWSGLGTAQFSLGQVGDMDLDGDIDLDDAVELAFALNDPSAYQTKHGISSVATGDLDGDGDVDFDDIDDFTALLHPEAQRATESLTTPVPPKQAGNFRGGITTDQSDSRKHHRRKHSDDELFLVWPAETDWVIESLFADDGFMGRT
jgi:hypothetical protein